jgi:hypothetical protein
MKIVKPMLWPLLRGGHRVAAESPVTTDMETDFELQFNLYRRQNVQFVVQGGSRSSLGRSFDY